MPSFSIYFAYPGELDTPTGGYRYDRRLIAELRQLKVEVTTISLPPCGPVPNQQALNTIEQTMAALPDQALVVIDGLAFGVLDDLAAKEAHRLKLVALCHHPLALETGIDDSLMRSLMESERRALSLTRATIVTSEHTKKILIDQFAAPPEKVLTAPPGTDPVSLAPGNGYPVRLLTVASLTPRKAHDALIDSLAELAKLPWQARFVGGGEFDPAWAAKLQARVKNLGLSERICFAGAVDDARAEYQQADAFVLPSRFEGYGMAFAEAVAAGLPVIAARAGAVPDVVPETAGLLVPPDDGPALTEALRQLISNPSLRRQLQRGARQAASNLPLWSDTATIVAGKLEEVAKA